MAAILSVVIPALYGLTCILAGVMAGKYCLTVVTAAQGGQRDWTDYSFAIGVGVFVFKDSAEVLGNMMVKSLPAIMSVIW